MRCNTYSSSFVLYHPQIGSIFTNYDTKCLQFFSIKARADKDTDFTRKWLNKLDKEGTNILLRLLNIICRKSFLSDTISCAPRPLALIFIVCFLRHQIFKTLQKWSLHRSQISTDRPCVYTGTLGVDQLSVLIWFRFGERSSLGSIPSRVNGWKRWDQSKIGTDRKRG